MSTIASEAAPPTTSPVKPRLSERIDAMPAWLGATAGLVVILAVWWIASVTLFQASHAIPTPPSVFAYFFDADAWSSLLSNLSGTLPPAATGYLWGNLAALLLAALVMLVPFLSELVNQIAIVTYCIPTVAIGPLIILIADDPDTATIALAALGVFFTTVVGSLLGLRAAPRTSLDLVRAYGGTKLTQLRKVQVISAMPSVLAALKLAAPAAFLGAVLAEYLGSGGDSSLGKALLAAQFASNAPLLWYLAIASGAVAGLAYFLVGLIGRFVTPWSGGSAAMTGAH